MSHRHNLRLEPWMEFWSVSGFEKIQKVKTPRFSSQRIKQDRPSETQRAGPSQTVSTGTMIVYGSVSASLKFCSAWVRLTLSCQGSRVQSQGLPARASLQVLLAWMGTTVTSNHDQIGNA